MEKVLIKDAHIVNEGTIVRGDVYIEHENRGLRIKQR